MFISKKKFKALERRIADLEGQVQDQQSLKIKLCVSDTDANNLIEKYGHERHFVG
jgi:hypothetical protein